MRVGQELSQWNPVVSGVPQGSVLGPLLFIIFIWDLQITQIMNNESIKKIYKYVDDTKVVSSTKNLEDTIKLQESLDQIYDWQKKNNMLFNGGKFVRITSGPNQELKHIPLFTPEYSDIIQWKEFTKDLGILIDDKINYSNQRNKALQKAKNKSSWVLRTFYNRDISVMKQLWKSLIQPVQDYGSLIWTPCMEAGELKAQEQPLRQYSRRIKGLENLNYWQRLKRLKLLSSERRNERYRLFYVWKSLMGLVPSLNFKLKTDLRHGPKIVIENMTGCIRRVQTLRERTVYIAGAKIFNSMPRYIREFKGEFAEFKKTVDQYLSEVPDCPLLEGYISHNLDRNLRMSNSLIVWSENMNTYDWVPKTPNSESGDIL